MAYAILASAMPRAGGSYVYASRALNPYLGFVASFSQWFGLSIAIGVVSYVIVPFLRDIAAALEMQGLAATLETGSVRVALALAFLWIFVVVNLRGVKLYERTLVPLMFLMFALGAVVIVAGFSFDQATFAAALLEREGAPHPGHRRRRSQWSTFLAASALLFASFIGFDSIAQAGGEARNPGRSLAAGDRHRGGHGRHLLFSVHRRGLPRGALAASSPSGPDQDLTAPGLLGYLLSPGWTVAIVAGAAVALINDLPAMLLAVSRLMFAWAEDGIFPRRGRPSPPALAHTPRGASSLSGVMAIGRHPRQPSGRRLLSRRRHPGDLDAGQLPGHVPVGVSGCRGAIRRWRARSRCSDPAALQVSLAVAGVVSARRVSRRPHLEGPDIADGGLVLPLHRRSGSRDGDRQRHLFPRDACLRRSGVDVEAIFSELPPEYRMKPTVDTQ